VQPDVFPMRLWPSEVMGAGAEPVEQSGPSGDTLPARMVFFKVAEVNPGLKLLNLGI